MASFCLFYIQLEIFQRVRYVCMTLLTKIDPKTRRCDDSRWADFSSRLHSCQHCNPSLAALMGKRKVVVSRGVAPLSVIVRHCPVSGGQVNPGTSVSVFCESDLAARAGSRSFKRVFCTINLLNLSSRSRAEVNSWPLGQTVDGGRNRDVWGDKTQGLCGVISSRTWSSLDRLVLGMGSSEPCLWDIEGRFNSSQ